MPFVIICVLRMGPDAMTVVYQILSFFTTDRQNTFVKNSGCLWLKVL